MNHKVTLSLAGTDVNRAPISRNQIFMFILGLAVVLLVATTVFLSASAVRSNVSSGIAVEAEADTARWIAMGEYYRAEASEAERSAAANVARWDAMADYYSDETFDAERSMAANTARWNAMAEHYAVDNSLSDATYSARYQAMADWYSGEQ